MASVRVRFLGSFLGALLVWGCGAVEDTPSATEGGKGGSIGASGGSSAGGTGGSSTAGRGGSSAGSGGSTSAGTGGGAGEAGSVTVTTTPRPQATLPVFDGAVVNFAQVVVADFKATVVQPMSLALAFGPGYPSKFTAQLEDSVLAACGGFPAKIELTEAISNTRAVSATVRGDASIELQLNYETETEIVAKGSITALQENFCVAQGTHAFELRLAVKIFTPTGAEFVVPQSCRAASVKRVAPGGRMRDQDDYMHYEYAPMFRVLPLDASGTPVTVRNAQPGAQMAVRIEAEDSLVSGATLASLDEFVFPNTPGRVTFTPEIGEPLVVEVVDPVQVDRIDMPFLLAGTSRVAVPIVNGEIYDTRSDFKLGDLIAPMAVGTYVGDDALCSAPAPAWFEWESETPEVCSPAPFAPNEWERSTLRGMNIGRGARLLEHGTCALNLRAPALNGGAGLVESVSAEFLPEK